MWSVLDLHLCIVFLSSEFSKSQGKPSLKVLNDTPDYWKIIFSISIQVHMPKSIVKPWQNHTHSMGISLPLQHESWDDVSEGKEFHITSDKKHFVAKWLWPSPLPMRKWDQFSVETLYFPFGETHFISQNTSFPSILPFSDVITTIES